MPANSKSGNGPIPVADTYSVSELARIMGVAGTTVRGLMDAGELRGFWKPGRRPLRRVTHQAVIAFVRQNPRFGHILDRLEGCERVELPEGTLAPPVRTQFSAPPRSPHRPRGLRHGKVPLQPHYSLSQVGYVLGLHRRTIWQKVAGRRIGAIRVPTEDKARNLVNWQWRIPHACLLRFITSDPRLSYARNRLAPEPEPEPVAESRPPR
jgi:excisionase family DNA binding protein